MLKHRTDPGKFPGSKNQSSGGFLWGVSGTELTTLYQRSVKHFQVCGQTYARQMNHLPTNEQEKIGEIFTYIDFNQGAVLISKVWQVLITLMHGICQTLEIQPRSELEWTR